MVVVCLKVEYNVDVIYEGVSVNIVCWVSFDDVKKFEEFKCKCESNLVLDGGDNFIYIVLSCVNLNLLMECYLDIKFNYICEN